MLIIRCFKCNTPQYINDGQKTRICPSCGTIIQCKKMNIFGRTESIKDANLIVRMLKTPEDVRDQIPEFNGTRKSKKSEKEIKNKILGKVLSQLSKDGIKEIPLSKILSLSRENGLDTKEDEDFIKDIFLKLNHNGLAIIKRNKLRELHYFFPSLPFNYGKLYVSN